MAKAPNQNRSDSEERKPGEQSGLDIENFSKFSTKYPRSPGCKRCELDVACPTWMCGIERKLFSSPPGNYGRKAET